MSSFRTYKNVFAEDTNGSPLAVQQLLQVMDQEQWSQELRLNADIGEITELTIGAFTSIRRRRRTRASICLTSDSTSFTARVAAGH